MKNLSFNCLALSTAQHVKNNNLLPIMKTFKNHLLKSFLYLLIISFSIFSARGQGLCIPSKHWGISFGNSMKFTGLRINVIEKDIERINGIDISVWGAKDEERQTGAVNGLSIGLPLIAGTEYRNGISVGIAGVSAKKDLNGINLGLIGAGSGHDVNGINIGGLGVGAGNDLKGISFGALGAGAGGNIKGITLGGFGAGAGGDVKGITVGGLGAGAGGNTTGFMFGGLGAGAGGDVTGITIGGLGAGAGGNLTGLTVAGLGVGCGNTIRGLSFAIGAVGAPEIKGLQVALAVGGNKVTGINLAPAYFRVEDEDAVMKGISVSTFNHIKGYQKGVAIGIINHAREAKGIQIGVLNHIADNPKGLRWLPVFNASFK
jgi:hypothetical protein